MSFHPSQPVIAIPITTTEDDDTKELVVASLKGDAVSWISQHLPEWKASIYTVNDPTASLTVPANKGRESMVYLTCVPIPQIAIAKACLTNLHKQSYHRQL
jgi:hypothetical protein